MIASAGKTSMETELLVKPEVKTFFDETNFTATHLVTHQPARRCAIIDLLLDYDPTSGCTGSGRERHELPEDPHQHALNYATEH